MFGPIWNAIGNRKLNIDPKDSTWSFYASERVGPDYKLTGATMRMATRGKKKGRLVPVKETIRECVITQAEIAAQEHVFEVETGWCAKCRGTGTYVYSWSVKDGKVEKPCRTCLGKCTATTIKEGEHTIVNCQPTKCFSCGVPHGNGEDHAETCISPTNPKNTLWLPAEVLKPATVTIATTPE